MLDCSWLPELERNEVRYLWGNFGQTVMSEQLKDRKKERKKEREVRLAHCAVAPAR